MTESVHPGAEDEYDRVSAQFPPGAPDVAVSWVSVERVTLTPLPPDHRTQERDLHWHVYGLPGTDETFHVHGDLALNHNGWFLGVTSVASLMFRGGARPFDADDLNELNAHGRMLGAWCSTLLYDVAAMNGRALIAANVACDLQLPNLTPQPHYPQIDADDEVVDIPPA